jgi:hypothetical protein
MVERIIADARAAIFMCRDYRNFAAALLRSRGGLFMTPKLRRLAPLALVLLAACHQLDAEDVAVWANSGSALGVYTHLHTPVGFVLGDTTFVDPTCPVTSTDGTTTTITGGCTDSEGKRFEGEVTIIRVDGPRDLDVDFDGYGSGEGDIATNTGTASIRQLDGSAYSYDVDLVSSGGVTLDIDYSGTIVGDYGQPTLFSGSGVIIRNGFTTPTGTANVSTDDQLVDDAVCSGQSASGATTIEVDGHVIVVTYDGATDCDENHAARLTVDGKDQGLVEGITCAVTSGGRAGVLGSLMLLGLGIARSRRRASRSEAR